MKYLKSNSKKLDPRLSKLDFREPREPRVPKSIIRAEDHFLKSSAMKLSRTNGEKEKAMNLARKKLEIVNLEDHLLGFAKEKARKIRLDKKNKRGFYKNS